MSFIRSLTYFLRPFLPCISSINHQSIVPILFSSAEDNNEEAAEEDYPVENDASEDETSDQADESDSGNKKLLT